MKPKDKWDREDWLDYLDGWHEACDPKFKTTRVRGRRVTHRDLLGRRHTDLARETFEQGEADQANLAA